MLAQNKEKVLNEACESLWQIIQKSDMHRALRAVDASDCGGVYSDIDSGIYYAYIPPIGIIKRGVAEEQTTVEQLVWSPSLASSLTGCTFFNHFSRELEDPNCSFGQRIPPFFHLCAPALT